MEINDEWIASVPLLCSAESLETLFSPASENLPGKHSSAAAAVCHLPHSLTLSLHCYWHAERRGSLCINTGWYFYMKLFLCSYQTVCVCALVRGWCVREQCFPSPLTQTVISYKFLKYLIWRSKTWEKNHPSKLQIHWNRHLLKLAKINSSLY